jgi:hypothetical protein
MTIVAGRLKALSQTSVAIENISITVTVTPIDNSLIAHHLSIVGFDDEQLYELGSAEAIACIGCRKCMVKNVHSNAAPVSAC